MARLRGHWERSAEAKQRAAEYVAKCRASRANGKTIGEMRAMGSTVTNIDGNGREWAAEVSYRERRTNSDTYSWRVEVFLDGSYLCHNLFETIEEAESYAYGMTAERI